MLHNLCDSYIVVFIKYVPLTVNNTEYRILLNIVVNFVPLFVGKLIPFVKHVAMYHYIHLLNDTELYTY